FRRGVHRRSVRTPPEQHRPGTIGAPAEDRPVNMIGKVQSDDGVERSRPITAAVARLSRPQKVSLVALPLALIAGVVMWESRGAPMTAAPPAPIVTVATPLVRQIAEWDDYSGRFEASKSVEIRPRVS